MVKGSCIPLVFQYSLFFIFYFLFFIFGGNMKHSTLMIPLSKQVQFATVFES